MPDSLMTIKKKSNLQVAHTIPNKLREYIKTGKNKLRGYMGFRGKKKALFQDFLKYINTEV